MSSDLITKFCWYFSPGAVTILPRLHFKVPSRSTQLPLSKTSPFKKVWVSLSLLKMIVISCTPTEQAHGIIPGGNFINCSINFSTWSKLQLSSQNYFKVFITWTAPLTGIVEDSHVLWNILGSFAECQLATVSFMHKLRMEMRQPTVSACPLLWIRWEKLKDIKLNIFAYFSWMCCLVTEFVYANTIILFNLSEIAFRIFTPMPRMSVNILPLFTSISENNC